MKRTTPFRTTAALLAAALLPHTAWAAVFTPGPSDSSLFDTVIDVPPETIGDRQSFGGVTGQTTQVNVSDGGVVGTIVMALSGVEFNITGGTVGDRFQASDGSEVNISGGNIGLGLNVQKGSEVRISGGSFGVSIAMAPGGWLDISGGVFPENAILSKTGSNTDQDFAQISFSGTGFTLSGDPYDTSSEPAFLTGLLLDGNQLRMQILELQANDRLLINGVLIPEPSSLALLGLSGLCVLRRRRGTTA